MGKFIGAQMSEIVADREQRSVVSCVRSNYEVPYLRFIFGFMGITNVRFIQAGGTRNVMQGRISAEEFLSPYLKEIAFAV
jgi:FMN-dependent NADH-azoreductase